MEWRVFFQMGTRTERRTALVQLSDETIILLVQVSAMESKQRLWSSTPIPWLTWDSLRISPGCKGLHT